ncbi:hypothetical protein [Bacillus tropicus]|uniref:hypothetical protein n=1 Tax=Bacillus tropicus TaxID=2026188 RepID=UPI0023B0531A|nr:hypothetical protein [Bacillus tropicus]MDE7552914.1 hypothetical protein [Bacillus tropicus]MDE7574123.1 hypothetical protein [Bacillus tropicus]
MNKEVRRYKIILGIILGLILVWAVTTNSNVDKIEEGYTHQLDFENKLKEYSNSMILIEDSKIEHRDKENDNIYKANWEGFELYAKMGKVIGYRTPYQLQQTRKYLRIKLHMSNTIN